MLIALYTVTVTLIRIYMKQETTEGTNTNELSKNMIHRILSTAKRMVLRKDGGSYVVTVPKQWIETFPFFANTPTLDGRIEDIDGEKCLVLKIVRD